jgi:catechol 2,3-dioxygenase-like lactoylglutathione lyase family enzyme
MLADHDAIATIGVKKLDVAAKFYEGVLGLKKQGGDTGPAFTYLSGKSKLFVYESQYAGTNQATAASWIVSKDDFDGIIQSLKEKGAKFEHYDLPGLELEGDVHVHGSFKVAWLKDPDGNILQILNP